MAVNLSPLPWGLTPEAWASAPSPQLLRWACKQLLGWEVLAGTDLCAKFSLFCLPWTCLCALCALLWAQRFWGSAAPPDPAHEGVSECEKLFLLHSSLPEVQDPSNFLCLFIFLLPFSCYFMWSLACLFGSLRSSTRLQQVFYRCSRCRYIVNVFVGRKMISMSSVQLLSRVRLFATPWTAACQASLFITNSRSLPKPMSIESVMPSNHLILCRPLLLLPSIFPCIRVFSNESALHIRWPKHWSFSFRISPSNEHQDWSPLGWTGWTSLQSKGLSRVFSNTTVQKHQFFGAQLSF